LGDADGILATNSSIGFPYNLAISLGHANQPSDLPCITALLSESGEF